MSRDRFKSGAARITYWLAGIVSRVRRPMRMYKLDLDSDAFTFAGWSWQSITTTYRLIELSERIDPDHWAHWALNHDNCLADYCWGCGGQVCREDDLASIEVDE